MYIPLFTFVGATFTPTTADEGKPIRRGAARGKLGEGLCESDDPITVLVWTTAGTGVITVEAWLWGYSPDVGRWFVIKKLNGGVAIAETSADQISYAEEVNGWQGFSRLVVGINALAGTAPSFGAALLQKRVY